MNTALHNEKTKPTKGMLLLTVTVQRHCENSRVDWQSVNEGQDGMMDLQVRGGGLYIFLPSLSPDKKHSETLVECHRSFTRYCIHRFHLINLCLAMLAVTYTYPRNVGVLRGHVNRGEMITLAAWKCCTPVSS